MKRSVCIGFLLAGILISYSQAAPTIINVVEDARVKLVNDTNYGSEQNAVVGRDSGSVINRLYLKFELPTLDAGYEYGSATLYGYYYWDTWDSTDREFSWYRAADDTWNESTITGNNAPAYSGDAIATWTPSGTSYGAGGHAYNEWQSWDIVSVLNAETDSYLTLVIKQTDETKTSGLESFRTKEYSSGQFKFYIDYTTRQTQSIPVPGALILAGFGLSCFFGIRKHLSR